MKYISLAFTVIVVLCTLPASVGADVVTVLPDPQPTDTPVGEVGVGETTLTRGWSIVSNASGWGKLCTYGPSTYQSRTGAFYAHYLDWYNDAWYPDTDMGRGAFYATCHFDKGTYPRLSGDYTPSTIWLGTDQWRGESVVGKTLGSITACSYFSFMSKEPCRQEGRKGELEWWGKMSWWRGPQQPIQLQFTIESPDHTERRQVWYRPWGYNFSGDDGMTEPGSQKGRWQWFNCLYPRPGGEGKWYMPCTGTTPNTLEYGWDAWSDFLAFQLPEGPLPPFSDWVLCMTDKSPGWDERTVPPGTINSTGTGKPINFFLGARVSLVYQRTEVRSEDGLTYPMENTGLFFQGNPGYPVMTEDDPPEPYPPMNFLWPNASHAARAQVDYFTLGFNNVDETCDFEPSPSDPPAHIMAASHKSLDVLRSPLMYLCNQWNGNLYRVVGRVGFANLQYFEIEDGSKLTYLNKGYDPDWTFQVLPGPIRVYIQPEEFRGDPWWINTGAWVEVWGYVEPLRFAFPNPPELGRDGCTPLMMWTTMNNITVTW